MKLNRGKDDEEREQRKEKKGEKQTQGFRERGEVGVGEGKGRDFYDGGEPVGDGCGKDMARDLQGKGQRRL